MIYLRQLWKQKPEAWGPASDVSAVLRDRLQDWYGISWDKVGLVLPMWGPGNQQDYGPGSLIGKNSGVVYQRNGLYFTTDNTISFSPDPVINNPGKFTVLLTQNDVDITYNDYVFTKDKWFFKIASSSARQYSFTLDLYGTDIYRTWKYQPEGTLDDLAMQWTGETDLPSGLGVLNFYRNGEIQTPFDTSALSGGTVQDDSSGNLNIGNLTKTFMTSFVMIKEVLSQNQIADFNANALFQRPTFRAYFDLAGDEAVSVLDGKVVIRAASSILLDGLAAIKNSVSDLLDGKAKIIAAKSDLFDGKSVVKSRAVDNFDAKSIILSTSDSIDNLDGKAIIHSILTTIFDGKISVQSVASDLLDGKTIVANADTDLIDGKSIVKDVGTNLFDGKGIVQSSAADSFDGKSVIFKSSLNNLDGKIAVTSEGFGYDFLDGKTTIKSVATNYLDGLIYIGSVSDKTLDGKVIIKSSVGLNIDGNVTIKDIASDLLDGSATIQTNITNIVDGKAVVTGANLGMLDGKAIIQDNGTVLLDGKVFLTTGYDTNVFDGKVILSVPVNGKVTVTFSMRSPAVTFSIR